MSKLFGTDTKDLKFLLSSIHNKERALPNFQRDFVWDAWMVQELLDSILRSFPVGSILELQQDKNVFQPRSFAGAPELPNSYTPPYLILDGQQRLTSLYQALYGAGRHRFYVSISKIIDSAKEVPVERPLFEVLDIEDALFHDSFQIRKGKVIEKDKWPIERQAKELVFPLTRVMTSGGYEEWRDEVVGIRKNNKEYKDGDNDILRRIGKELIDNLTNYLFPVITLQTKIPTEAICTIFETLNRTGVKLSAFDLLVARFYPQDINLRDSWNDAQSDYPILKDFWIDPYYLLQSIALRCDRRGMGECKRGMVLKLEADDYRKLWQSTVNGFGIGLKILREDCGVLTSAWIPYATFLVPFASVIADTKDNFKGADIAGWKSKLQKWFWASTFAQSYENAPNTASKLHYTSVIKWLINGEIPDFVKQAEDALSKVNILEITPRQRARYRGFMCVILRKSIRDFYKADAITPAKISSGDVNDHHIFPHAVFGKGEWSESIDCIANRTLIDELSNKIIRDKRPSEYIPILKKQLDKVELDGLFSQHLIPVGQDSPTWRDDLSGFLDMRSKSLLSEGRKLIGVQEKPEQEKSTQ